MRKIKVKYKSKLIIIVDNISPTKKKKDNTAATNTISLKK